MNTGVNYSGIKVGKMKFFIIVEFDSPLDFDITINFHRDVLYLRSQKSKGSKMQKMGL